MSTSSALPSQPTHAAPTSLHLLDQIIQQVQTCSITASTNNNNNKQAGNNANSSLIPTETKDVAWWPIIGIGHTAYTWYGVEAQGETSNLSAPPAAAPPSASPAASSSSATPPPAAGGAGKPNKPAGEKKEKAAKPAPAAAAASSAPEQPDYTKLDIRVGQIVSASRHPKPDVTSLYVEKIDVGEAEPREVVSGLVKYIPLEEFSKARVCVICNLKPSPLQGVTSHGMVLAASTGEGDARKVELIVPPPNAPVGTRLLPLNGDYSQFAPVDQVDPKKKNNVWSTVAPLLKTNDAKEATWNGLTLGCAGFGAATAPSLAGAQIA